MKTMTWTIHVLTHNPGSPLLQDFNPSTANEREKRETNTKLREADSQRSNSDSLMKCLRLRLKKNAAMGGNWLL